MKLITEMTEDVRMIVEKTDEDGTKSHYIEGIFMQAERKNRNGRVYPQKVLADEVVRYNKEFVAKNRAMGELNHPDGPTVNLDRVSHIIKELRTEGSDIVGKAKILETPMGKIAKNLIDEGAKLGVSSRGMGSLEERRGVNYVKDDFMLSAVDLVADPSAPGAFVNGIMEGKEWIWDNGMVREKRIEEYKHVIENACRQDLEEKALSVFKDFMSSI
tara:strand:+ start:2520 stop:3167 length:648 start_codon:yes stop_codon:yes gene_type:complete